MTQVNYFFSTNSVNGNLAYSAPGVAGAGSGTGTLNSGTSTLSTDAFELRVSTGTTGMLTPTKKDVEMFLELCKRWLHDEEGSPTISGSGLNGLLKANSATVGIP